MALKSLHELNLDFVAAGGAYRHEPDYKPIKPMRIEIGLPETMRPAAASKAETKRRFFTFASNIIFYIAIALILLTALTSGTGNGAPKTVFGYSCFTVVSKSMQDEIPKGSFIIVRGVAPQDLNVGDTITYMRDRDTSVTHKIIGVYENYDRSGARGFQTMGVNNSGPDSDIVYEANVVGKVIFAVPAVGAVLSGLAANVYLIFIIFVLCVAVSFCMRGLFVKGGAAHG